MHRSRLAGIIVDCQTQDLEGAAKFWAAALGLPVVGQLGSDPGYRHLARAPGDLHVEVQQVTHESRVHIDIESDNPLAEAARLEALGATRVKAVKDWIVMQAPTGQRFCIVPVESTLFEAHANRWK
jgi:catechol 2,3-dioxygenase-like lactoylglutathione lyase family enzyme